jgi:FkbM family methyltransferase
MKMVKKWVFTILDLNGYLTLMRKLHFLAFYTGLLRKNNTYEWHYFIKKLIKKGDIIIDIGANLGYYAYVFSKLTGKQGEVHCVEPVTPFQQQLISQLKHQSNYRIYPFALGEENKEHIVLGVPTAYRHDGYLHTGLPSILHGGYTAGDSYIFDSSLRKGSEVFAGLTRLDYIKCDVEGYEALVFKDLSPVLAQHLPIVQAEISANRFEEMVHFFEQIGYKGFKLNKGSLMPLHSLSRQEQLNFDTLFVPMHRYNRIRAYVLP